MPTSLLAFFLASMSVAGAFAQSGDAPARRLHSADDCLQSGVACLAYCGQQEGLSYVYECTRACTEFLD